MMMKWVKRFTLWLTEERISLVDVYFVWMIIDALLNHGSWLKAALVLLIGSMIVGVLKTAAGLYDD